MKSTPEQSLKSKNAQLEKQLAEKNHDLEIEAALERVRTVAMGMRNPGDLLSICRALFAELQLLDFSDLRNAIIHTYLNVNYLIDYDYSDFTQGHISHIPYSDNPIAEKYAKDIRKTKDAFAELIITGSKLKEWKVFMDANNEAPDERLGNAISLYYYIYAVGDASIGISTFSPIQAEKLDVLKRFRNVFDLAYSRFVDINKAGAQAREAQIELALERVRARTMAMQHSEELAETAFILFQQFKELGENPDQATIGIINEEEQVIEYWVTMYGSQVNKMFKFPIDEPIVTHKIYKAWKAKKTSLVIDLSGKYLHTFTKYRESMGGAKFDKNEKRRVINVAFFSKGLINVQSSEERSAESIRLLERFAGVFDGTYTRFLDLKKAEAQAREAQIELSLERVRASAMAMHKTEDLHVAGALLFKGLAELGINTMAACYALISEDERSANYYGMNPVDGKIVATPWVFPHTETEVMRAILASWKKHDAFYVIELDERDTLKHHTWAGGAMLAGLKKVDPDTSFTVEAFLAISPQKAILHTFNFPQGYLFIATGQRLTTEQEGIARRFTKVFEMTYRRFLDLQKAEAQTRESQIELALERVRARTMAMQKSGELKEIIKVVYEQLIHLNILAEHAGFIMDYQANDNMNIWLADKHFDPSYVSIPYFDSPHWNSFIEAKKKGTGFFANLLSFEEKNKFYRDLFALVPGVTDEAMEFYMNCTGLAGSTVLLDNVGLYIENFSGIPYTDEENSMLMRFGKVFQQTYTRFLDLQKAEEQTREAQIELSLERVRASAMAMHKTNQLMDAAELLYKELTGLGINSITVAYSIMAGDEKSAAFYSINPVGGKINPVPLDLPHAETKVMRSILSSWKKQETFSKLELDEKATLRHQTYIAGIVQAHFAENNFDQPFSVEAFLEISPKKAVIYTFNFAQGYIFIIGSEHLTKPQEEMVMRFTKVFEMTYRRFLDLKQAEEQARESKIQLALERVRARTSAMQKSEELHEVIQLVFDQLQQLNFNIDNANFALNYKETDDLDLWLAAAGAQYATKICIPYFNHPVFERFNKTKEKGGLFADTLSFDEKNSFFEHFFKYTPEVTNERKAFIFEKPGFARSAAFMKNTALTIINYQGIPYSEAENNTLLRFGQVFDQTYTRFTDLKQAEEQAREAQIQLGLERVRAKAMAMQTSEELNELIGTVFSELTKLDFVLTRCLIMIFDPETKASRWWMANSEAPAEPMNYLVQNHKNPAYDAYLKAWKERHLKWRYALKGKVKRDWDNFLFVDTELVQLPGPVIAGMKAPEQVLLSASFNNFGCLTLVTLEPLSDEHSEIMLRFAKVFDMSYTRFNDLKQAEAQAREAQIQLGLERVRARAMAMQSSDELTGVVDIVFKELTKLDFGLTHCAIAIADADSVGLTLWQANSEPDQPPISFYRKSFDHPYPNAAYKEWKKRTPKWIYHLKGAEKKDMHDYYASSQETRYVPDAVKEGMAAYDSIILSHSFNNFGYLRTDTKDPLSENNLDIVYRFAKAFDLCYTRFTDIKQAEAQAHEAQIQLALERVRARTMAMQHSEELAETVSVLFKQLLGLGIPTGQIRTCGIVTFDAKEAIGEQWITEMNGDIIPRSFMVPYNEAPAYKTIYQWWKKGEEFKVNHLEGGALQEHLGYLAKYTKVPLSVLTEQSHDIYNHALFFSQGYLFIITRSAMDEYHDVFKRFGAVFQQSYTRFLDLKKAEEQAKESKIQLALERVRARTMAMQKSDELAETATVLFQQLLNLGINSERTFIAIPNDDMRKFELWGTEQGGNQMSTRFEYEADATYAFREIYKAWLEKRNEFTVILKGKKLEEHVNYVRNVLHMPLSVALVQKQRILYNAFFSKGLLMIVTPEVQPEETLNILKRFAAVFDQTYTRFLDLQKAEAQTREGHIQLGLERVRAAALAMHDSNDVGNATALVFSELYKLGITTIRCGVCIIDGATQQMEVWSATSSQEGKVNRGAGKLDMTAHPLWIKLWNAWKKKQSSFTYELKGKELADYYKAITNASGYHAPDNNAVYMALDDEGKSRQFCNCFLFNEGCVFAFTQVPFSTETSQVLEKFTAVFGLTYRRYLDLTRAEAQAREAQIESALERVRSKTMAMHNSEDVADTVATMFNELVKLGVEKTARCGISIIYDNREMELWRASYNADGKADMLIGRIDMTIHSSLKEVYQAWKNNDAVYSCELTGDNQQDYFRALNDSPTYPVQFDLASLPVKQTNTVFFFPEGCLFAFTLEPLSEETVKLFKRFAGVFGQTYRRYLDLLKAEAQAREARIEAALERVRSKTMAMHNSADVGETVTLMFNELIKLGVEKMARCGIAIPDDKRTIELWTAKFSEGEKAEIIIGHIDTGIHPMLGSLYDAWKSKQPTFEHILKGDDLVNYITALNNSAGYPIKYDMKAWGGIQYHNDFFFAEGMVFAFTSQPLSTDTAAIFKRFSGVFGQTYRRYLDLLKAEASAREAQIEAALERVRSKTMAMHNSQDVGDTVGVMFHEFVKLGIEKMIRCGIGIMSHENRTMELWTAKWGENEKVNLLIGHLDMTIHKMLGSIYDAWKSKQPDFTYHLAGSDLVSYAKVINSYPDYPLKYDLNSLPPAQFFNDFYFNEGVVFAFTSNSLSDEIVTVLKRFAGVFGQTYRRYLDLQKAENQAREAQIEAALERVRSKAMAMRSSGDLNDTANTVFIELRKLGVDLVRCGLGLMEKETHISTIHAATNSDEGGSLEVLGNIDMNIHPVFAGIYSNWRKNEDYFPVLEGKSLRAYYEKLHESGIAVPELKSGEKQYGYFLQFAYGSLYAWSGKQESEITVRTLKRFTSVISLTYTRYIELQKAESNTKEAVKQASLDRVRAEIASMRKRSDLERITPLIWDELTILGIPFIRCGVFIMDEEQKLIHTFLSTPDGKAIGAFHIPFNTSGNFEKMVDSWRNSMPYIDHWKEEAFSQFADALVKQGAISSKAQYMRTLPHEGVHLNFLPFLQGMLYVGNIEPLTDDNINLVQAVAEAFSTAYARYEDFNKLEAAKQQVDNTLTDLKAAQTKLIQSEKMASLGELTAGIAHEIQNPLNFVNNFSEVNQEMIDELAEELKAGNIEEALAIAADIKDNEEKINHHGKRADGIVKGMLQHSRTGGGEKQATNINTLADEFLRLSYHGLRAKDKEFNAELVTHFDEKLPKISVIPQDIGRVLLNLFNNAFYAVNQKKKAPNSDFKPEVTVTTLTENGQLVIKVKDNGVGMPEHIKEKIMQPFFTTKPTGEGTGLGLSLTYDMVVKGHGGAIQVNSVEGEGSEFIIQLPIS